MSFAVRVAPSTDFESLVIKRLNETGWAAFPFGQGQLPPECRDRLRRFEDGSRRPSLIRWMPDIITFREHKDGRCFVAVIDAKTAQSVTDNHSIELSAVETMEVYADRLFTPAFFVFANWTVLSPREARMRAFKHMPGSKDGRGSGTPYILVAKTWGRPFDAIFRPAVRSVT